MSASRRRWSVAHAGARIGVSMVTVTGGAAIGAATSTAIGTSDTNTSNAFGVRDFMMTSFSPDYFIHAANLLLVAAYSVRDILWLRLFAVTSSLISLPYFILQPTPQWAPIGWSVGFAGLNAFQSWRLYLERRPVKLTPTRKRFAGSRSRTCRRARFCGSSASGPGRRRLPASV